MFARTQCTESHFLNFLVPFSGLATRMCRTEPYVARPVCVVHVHFASSTPNCLTPHRVFTMARAFSQIHHISIVATATAVDDQRLHCNRARCSATGFLSAAACVHHHLCCVMPNDENKYSFFSSVRSVLGSLFSRSRCDIFSGLRKSPYARRFHFSSRECVCVYVFLRILSVDAWPRAHFSCQQNIL